MGVRKRIYQTGDRKVTRMMATSSAPDQKGDDGEPVRLDRRGKYYLLGERYLHRVVFEEHYGKIPKGNLVHHLDGNTHNNHYDNLIALPSQFYKRLFVSILASRRALSRGELEQMLREHELKYQTTAQNLNKMKAEKRNVERVIANLERQLQSTPK